MNLPVFLLVLTIAVEHLFATSTSEELIVVLPATLADNH